MRKYRVYVRGENFLLNLGGVNRRTDFYAARFVEAEDEEAAVCAVIELLRCDPQLIDSLLNTEPFAPLMYAEEVEELEGFDGQTIPGSGFTFYPKE